MRHVVCHVSTNNSIFRCDDIHCNIVTTCYTALHGPAAQKTPTEVPPFSKTTVKIATKFYGATTKKAYLNSNHGRQNVMSRIFTLLCFTSFYRLRFCLTDFMQYNRPLSAESIVQDDSWLVDITAGDDFLGLCDKKSGYKHMSEPGWLYGVMGTFNL